MAQKQDPRDIIIAELQAEVDYLMRTMKEVADVTDQVMEEQDRLHAIELENQGLRLIPTAFTNDPHAPRPAFRSK